MNNLKFPLLLTLLMCSVLTGCDRPTSAEQTSFSHLDADPLQSAMDAYKAGNKKEAFRLYEESAGQGNDRGQLNLGVAYESGRGVSEDDKEALAWYRKAAEQGDAGAQIELGWMYKYGVVIPKDDKAAANWFRKAAEQGDARAQYDLAKMYAKGEGVPQDDKEAVAWYRKAAEQGFAQAQYNLALMYDNGEGVPEDDVLAYLWFNMAGADGDKWAADQRNALSERMTPTQIEGAQELSRKCFKQNYKNCGK
jgi:uncharacterized protein